EVLEALRDQGIRICVVSNNLRHEQEEKLAHCGLEALVDDLVTSEDAGEIKPHPAPFEMALRRAGYGPKEAVMVGDSWPADIEGAVALGIRTVWLNRKGVEAPRPIAVPEVRSLCPASETVAKILGR
ncbi:Haloacid dehalogenase-like hydrolase domain protein, partial [mine drainage metagenome]